MVKRWRDFRGLPVLCCDGHGAEELLPAVVPSPPSLVCRPMPRNGPALMQHDMVMIYAVIYVGAAFFLDSHSF